MKHINAKLCTLLFFVFIFISKVDAQDRVIFVNGDTLKCSIYKENRDFLYFKQNSKGVFTKGKIAKDQVREWTYQGANVTQVLTEEQKPSDLINEVTETEKEEKKKYRHENSFRVSINAGSGFLVGNTEKSVEDMQNQGFPKEDAEKYVNDLVVGHTGKFTMHYQVSKYYWLGVLYNGFFSDTKMMTRMDYNDGYNWIYGEVGEAAYVNFAGPSIFSNYRFGWEKRFSVHSSYTIGPVFYRNEVEIMRQQRLLTGVAFGQNLDIGLEYFISPRWAITLDNSYFSSTLGKITIETGSSKETVDLEKDEINNLSRFEMTFGVIFYW
ncbi:MAG TPA: hypothetical protein PLC80_09240 [Draconibacterium sp.]|nr:hypothetical protein [Draconibacterium sp.]